MGKLLRRYFILLIAAFSCVIAKADTDVFLGEIPLDLGKSTTLDISAGGEIISLNWSSSSEIVVISDVQTFYSNSRCRITAVKSGTCIVECNYANSHASATSYVTYHRKWFRIEIWDGKPKVIELDSKEYDLIIGSPETFTAKIMPQTSEYSYVTWSTDNSNIATVASTGGKGETVRVSGVSIGTTTLNVTTDNGKKTSAKLNVFGNSPTSVDFELPEETCIYTGFGPLPLTFTPANHRSKVTWSSSNNNVAYFDEEGNFWTNQTGTAVITATTANGLTVRKQVEVVPYYLDVNDRGYYGSTDVSINCWPFITFSVWENPTQGPQWNDIALYKGSLGNEKVGGTLSLHQGLSDDWFLVFYPAEPLESQTTYRFFVPAKAVLNQYGGGMREDFVATFTTQKGKGMTLEIVLSNNKMVYPECSVDADIFFTTDGTEPTQASEQFLQNSFIRANKDFSLWCKAYKSGYSTVSAKRSFKAASPYYMSQTNIMSSLPYKVDYYNPYWDFDKDIVKGPAFDKLELLDSKMKPIPGEFFITGKRLVFVPNEPLTPGISVRIKFLEGVVCTKDGLPNDYHSAYSVFSTSQPTSATLTGVKFYQSEVLLNVGERGIAHAEPVPVNADYSIWEWSSSNETVVTVNNRGVLEAKSEGYATVTIKTDNGYSSTCEVYVGIVPGTLPFYDAYPFFEAPYVFKDVNPYLEFDKVIRKCDKFDNCFAVDYSNILIPGEFFVTDNRIVFVPDNPLQEDNIYALFIPQKAVMTNEWEYNNQFAYYMEPATEVSAELEGIEMLDKELYIDVGDRSVVLAKPVPLNANYIQWTWQSSDESVVTVTERGVITGVARGTATVTLSSDKGLSASCVIRVGETSAIKQVEHHHSDVFDVYNLQGHKVRQGVSAIKGLPRGIYIVKGKKLVLP